MLYDALLTLDAGSNLAGIAAATPSANTIDLSQARDLGPSRVPAWVLFTIAPTSATGGATLNVAIQTAPDNATWTTIEETGAQLLANLTPFAFRGYLPVVSQSAARYLRILYTPSAALTAGTVTATIGSEFDATHHYPKNYAA